MKTETTKAMQEALEAAVVRMSNGNGATHSAPPPTDLMGVLMSILPKLLQGGDAGEESLEKLQEKIEDKIDEKIDGLQKGDITALREQVLILRKQCHRLINGQVELLAAIQEIQRQQVTTNAVIVDIAHHLSRVQVVDGPSADLEEPLYESVAEPLPGTQAGNGAGNGPGSSQRRARQKAAKNLNRARS